MLQDLRHDLLLGDEGDDDATAAARAYDDVLAEDAQEQFGPRNARIATPRWQRLRRWRLFVRTDRLARSGRLHVRHDPAAPCGRGSEHSVVADEVSARRGTNAASLRRSSHGSTTSTSVASASGRFKR